MRSIVAILALCLSFASLSLASERAAMEEVKISHKALDMALSKNGKYAFVLAQDGVVYVYKTGWVEVGKNIVGKDIAAIRAGDKEDELFLLDKMGKLKVAKIRFSRHIDTSNSPFKGNPSATVEVVVFSDFECPHCATVAKTLETLFQQYPDKVKIVFKHCPLGYHKQALLAALASVAAGLQGKFWEYHDLLFDHQKELSPQKIEELAKALNLNMERFNKDRQSQEANAIVARDVHQAKELDIRGIPAVYINGELTENNNLETFKKAVEGALKKQEKDTKTATSEAKPITGQ